MSDKELVIQFFMEGYQNKNYGFFVCIMGLKPSPLGETFR